MMWYCSVDFQKNEFKQHIRLRHDIAFLQATVNREAIPLQYYSDWNNMDDNDPTNLFEAGVGRFWVNCCDSS